MAEIIALACRFDFGNAMEGMRVLPISLNAYEE